MNDTGFSGFPYETCIVPLKFVRTFFWTLQQLAVKMFNQSMTEITSELKLKLASEFLTNSKPVWTETGLVYFTQLLMAGYILVFKNVLFHG